MRDDFKDKDPNPTSLTRKRVTAKEQDPEGVAGMQPNDERKAKDRAESSRRHPVRKQETKRKREFDKNKGDKHKSKRGCETTSGNKKENLSVGKGNKNGVGKRRQLSKQCDKMPATKGQHSGSGNRSSKQEAFNHNPRGNTGTKPKKQYSGVRQGKGDAPSASSPTLAATAAGSALPLRRSENSRPHLGPKASAGRCASPSVPSRRAGVATRKPKGSKPKSWQNGRATMAGKNEEVLVEAFMTKRSQNKRTFTHTNWKERWFVLSPKNLIYYDGDRQSGRRKERGRVELIRVVAVESVDTAVFQRDFVFQLCYLSEDDDQYVLYIAAPTAQDREQWLDYIRKLVADNDCLSDKYHQGAFIKSQWSCCKGGKNTIACTDVTWTINHNNNPPGECCSASAGQPLIHRKPGAGLTWTEIVTTSQLLVT
ncbi:uncharacterized protein LOC122249350 [Penaeus japonicus]|uniref:uncharacterized protein LOC122249350 n=1 Tax=Penaeus japonicus TaxID=27405 RepID=UPI001C710108|nr:uncharacterized protein LOC122249350 [Penaeus japonicus]